MDPTEPLSLKSGFASSEFWIAVIGKILAVTTALGLTTIADISNWQQALTVGGIGLGVLYVLNALGLKYIQSRLVQKEKVLMIQKEKMEMTMRPPHLVPILALLSLFLAEPVQAQTTKATVCFGWRRAIERKIDAIPVPRITTDPAVTAALATIISQNAQILAILQVRGDGQAVPAAPIGQTYPHYILPQVLNPNGQPLQNLNPGGLPLQNLAPGGLPLQNLVPQGNPLQILPPETPPLQQLNPGGLLPGSQLAPNIVVPKIVDPSQPATPQGLNPGGTVPPLTATSPPRGYQRYTKYFTARVRTKTGRPPYVTVVYAKSYLVRVPVQKQVVQRRAASPRYRWAAKRYYRTAAEPNPKRPPTAWEGYEILRGVQKGIYLYINAHTRKYYVGDEKGKPLATIPAPMPMQAQKPPHGYQRYTGKRSK